MSSPHFAFRRQAVVQATSSFFGARLWGGAEFMFFVFLEAGSCNDGSHSCYFEAWPTLQEAEARIAKLNEFADPPSVWFIVQGRVVSGTAPSP